MTQREEQEKGWMDRHQQTVVCLLLCSASGHSGSTVSVIAAYPGAASHASALARKDGLQTARLKQAQQGC